MTRIKALEAERPIVLTGIGGNVYAICDHRHHLEKLADSIGKARSSIYFSTKHSKWAFRVKSQRHKDKLKNDN